MSVDPFEGIPYRCDCGATVDPVGGVDAAECDWCGLEGCTECLADDNGLVLCADCMREYDSGALDDDDLD